MRNASRAGIVRAPAGLSPTRPEETSMQRIGQASCPPPYRRRSCLRRPAFPTLDIRPGGYFLMADHYVTEKNERNSDLYFNSEDQRNVLIGTGFDRVTLVLDKGDMALYRARRP